MPTRFLSDEQRRRYDRYAGEPSEKQLDRRDLVRDANQVGCPSRRAWVDLDRALEAQSTGQHQSGDFALGTTLSLTASATRGQPLNMPTRPRA